MLETVLYTNSKYISIPFANVFSVFLSFAKKQHKQKQNKQTKTMILLGESLSHTLSSFGFG